MDVKQNAESWSFGVHTVDVDQDKLGINFLEKISKTLDSSMIMSSPFLHLDTNLHWNVLYE